MTSYMPILPIGMLHLIEENNVEDVFILPQFWHIPAYRDFYTSHSWRTVIIDNALYENNEAFPLPTLIEIAESITSISTYVVGPEKVGDGITTLSLVLNALAAHGPRGDKWRMMAVFQGSPHEMYAMYQSLRQYDIGFAIPVSMYRDLWSRAGLAYFTGIRGHYLHAFGIDDLTEIPDLVRAGFNSVDSSIAASAAVNSIDLFGYSLRILRRGRPDDPVRVDLLHTEFHQDVIDEASGFINDINCTLESIKVESR